MRLYVAYGSNLCKFSMRRRCPEARPLGKFYLTDAKLVFRGVADVEYSPGDRVPCGLWSISGRDEAELDRYEGVKSGFYYKERGIQILFRGEVHNPLIYLMCSRGVHPPSQQYVATLAQGYEDFGLDKSYLDQAIAESYYNKRLDEQTRARRERQRKSNNPRVRRLVKMPEEVAMRRLQVKNFDDAEEA